ncbi:MAG: restriction endonuclease subunit S [Caldilineaceae bacterium]|nr:restriction endonuclease subunit S [Caldilineaceae bacterium]
MERGVGSDGDEGTVQWRRATLGEVVELKRGYDLPRRERVKGLIPLISSSGITDSHAEAKARGPGVVTGRYGTLGKVFYVPEDFWPLNTTLYVRDFKGNDPRFIAYFLSSIDFSAYSDKAAVPGLNRNHLHQALVDVPPLHEQRIIAHILGTLDDKIELNRRMNETLEEMARALFKCWFVDFGPVRAKMEGRWRRGESLPGMPAELYELFPDRMVDSELGKIPAGWEVKEFGSLLEDVIGGDWGKEAPDGVHTEPVSIVRGTDLSSLSNGGTGSVPLRHTTKKKAERRRLRNGDIVIEVSGGSPTQSTGRSVLITQDVLERFQGTVVCASFCRRFRPHSWREALIASGHLDFIYSIGKMWYYQLQSTGIANFQTKQFLQEESITWPGDELLDRFTEVIEPIILLRARNDNITLAAQRNLLLPMLISGKLQVTPRRQRQHD